jgi:enterochelin esterase-like enzyme
MKGSCMTTTKTPDSPRIASLQQAIASGDPTALATFWQEIIEKGTPLIEPVEGDEKHHLVTFLWRDKGDTKNVVLWGGPAGLDHPEKNQMMHLLETDLWYRTYRVQTNLRRVYSIAVNDPLTELESSDFGTRFMPDPLNPHQFAYTKDEELPDEPELVMSILELPGAPPQPWIMPRPDVAKGKVEMYRLRSDILNNERRVWVYTPPGYTTSGEPYGLFLLFDGLAYQDAVPTPTIVDNLVSEGKIPPLVVVLVDSLDQKTRNRELPCHQPFVDFLIQELMPWVHEHYHVTDDPAQSIVGGSSYGGLAAAFVGLRASEVFGNVLSQSGSFWWDKDPDDDILHQKIIQEYVASPRLPLRFYLEVGLKERSGIVDMVLHNRHLRDVLILKGYEVHYSEFNGGHDYVCWRGSLADGLLALVGKTAVDASS